MRQSGHELLRGGIQDGNECPPLAHGRMFPPNFRAKPQTGILGLQQLREKSYPLFR